MKIAVVSNISNLLIIFRGPLLKLLVERGHEVHVLAPSFPDADARVLDDMGLHRHTYRLQRTGQNPVSDLATFRDLRAFFRRERPQASLTYFIKPNIYGGLAAALARVPRRVAMVEGLGYLFTAGGADSARRRLSSRLATGLLRASLNRAHTVLFLNPDDRSDFLERGIGSLDNTVLLGGIGVDLDHYSVRPLPEGPPVFLMISRLLKEKGVHEYVAAARQVRRDYPDARFLLVGGLDQKPDAISADEAASYADGDGIEWLGELTDVRPAITDSSVYVLPSYREGVPRSTQEAMAMGRPVVTTDVPGCRETVEEGRNGFLVSVRDVDALTSACRRFCERPGLIPAMGAESRRIAEERFDVDVVNERIYQVLTGGPCPSP